LAALSKTGFILMQGGHEGLQKSTINPGVLLINSYNYLSDYI